MDEELPDRRWRRDPGLQGLRQAIRGQVRLSLGSPEHRCRCGVIRYLQTTRRDQSPPGGRCAARPPHRPLQRPAGGDDRHGGQRRDPPQRPSGGQQLLLHDELRRPDRQDPRGRLHDPQRVSDHGACLHERPASVRLSAQRYAARPDGGAEHRADVDRCCPGARPRHSITEGEGGGARLPGTRPGQIGTFMLGSLILYGVSRVMVS